MSGVAADIPAAPDEPSGQATGNTSVASVHTSDEAAQPSESTQHSKNIPTEEDLLNFIYGRSSSTDKPCTDDSSDDLDPYMTSPRATLGKTAQTPDDTPKTAQTPDDTPQDPKSSFASFGDRGTTASVNAYGQIMQITKFLGAGRSGFLCTDRWDTPEPFYVQDRAQELMEKSSNYLPDCGFTLLEHATPQLDFVCDRWPRFTGNVNGYIVQIQCYVSHGKIFQQCILEKDPMQKSPEFQDWLELTLPLDELFILDSDIHIRDLDWREEYYFFNNAPYNDDESYRTHLENDGFSLVRTHTGLARGLLVDDGLDKHTDDTKSLDSITAELVITAFLNGRPQRLKTTEPRSPNFCIDISGEIALAEFDKRGRLEITVAYNLSLKDEADTWKSHLVPASHLTHIQEAFSARGFQEIQFSTNRRLNFAVRRNLEHILSHTTFEVPYLLCKYAKERLEQGADDKKDTNPASANQLRKDGTDTKPDSQAQETNTAKVVMVAKKIMPFNNLINQKSIIEPPDEWLYNEPDFLNSIPDLNGFDLPFDYPNMHKMAKALKKMIGIHDSHGTKIQLLDRIHLISESIGDEPSLKMLETIEAQCSIEWDSIPQQEYDESISTDSVRRVIWNILRKVDWSVLDRVPAKWGEEMRQLAKKFSSRPPDEDLIDAIAEMMSKIDETPSLSKGAIIDDHVLSRAAMGFRFDGDFFDRYWTCHFIEHKPKKEIARINVKELSKILQREGNLPKTERGKQPWRQRKVLELILFDRIVEEITTSTDDIMKTIRNELKDITGSMCNTTEGSSYKSDRKDLPAEWVFRESSIWNEEDLCPSTKPGETPSKDDALDDAFRAAKSVSNMKSEYYLSFSQKSQVLEQMLRVLDDDLGENLEQIERWRKRDDDRAPEKPRWTRNDERRYRTTITKMLASNDKKIRELEQCRSNVQSLKASLQSTREYIRDDLNLRNAEDVRLFTYVTATFLPISFATSIFSMGGFPGKALLGSMIGLAAVALLLTGIAIAHDKTLASRARVFKWLVGGYRSSSKQKPANSSSSPNDNKSGVAGDDPENENEGRATSFSFLGKLQDKARGHADIEKGIRKRRSE
ncbi:hypothetical protein SLS58_007339 [Diplodia intermedia]|uniref:Mg2+ transporter zinc transport protein n=1 Tax=Diplodia intermedia TaxID=856260 RepID=A0ABR3TL18_9PEZI